MDSASRIARAVRNALPKGDHQTQSAASRGNTIQMNDRSCWKPYTMCGIFVSSLQSCPSAAWRQPPVTHTKPPVAPTSTRSSAPLAGIVSSDRMVQNGPQAIPTFPNRNSDAGLRAPTAYPQQTTRRPPQLVASGFCCSSIFAKSSFHGRRGSSCAPRDHAIGDQSTGGRRATGSDGKGPPRIRRRRLVRVLKIPLSCSSWMSNTHHT